MEIINKLFLFWGVFVAIGTTIGLYRYRAALDRGSAISVGANLLYAAVTIISALGYLMPPIPDWWAWTVTPIGFLILGLSQALSIWSARHLGKSLSPQLTPTQNAELVTSGPYQLCRHPIMLSFLMGWVGTALALGSPLIILAFSVAAPPLMWRIAIEDKNLEARYGDSFRNYKARVSILMPFVDPSSKDGQEVEQAFEHFSKW